MSEIIEPSVAARLRFFVTDPTTGVGVTGLTHSTITTAGYATEVHGVRSSTTSVTLTSTAAVTAALATGQVVEYGFGQYGIDVPAVGTSGLIFAVVTVTGKEVRAVRNQIREAAELNSGGQDAIAAKVATLLAESHGAGSWEGGGGAGGTDWTVEQRAQILSSLGIGDEETVEPVVITPAAPGETTAYAVVRDSSNAPKPGVIVSVILANVKQNADGNMWQKQARSFTSQANGLVEITHLIPGQAYYITVGSVQAFVTIPASAAAAYALEDIAFT